MKIVLLGVIIFIVFICLFLGITFYTHKWLDKKYDIDPEFMWLIAAFYLLIFCTIGYLIL